MICENIYTYTYIYAVNVYVMCVFFRLLIFIRLRIEAGKFVSFTWENKQSLFTFILRAVLQK